MRPRIPSARPFVPTVSRVEAQRSHEDAAFDQAPTLVRPALDEQQAAFLLSRLADGRIEELDADDLIDASGAHAASTASPGEQANEEPATKSASDSIAPVSSNLKLRVAGAAGERTHAPATSEPAHVAAKPSGRGLAIAIAAATLVLIGAGAGSLAGRAQANAPRIERVRDGFARTVKLALPTFATAPR